MFYALQFRYPVRDIKEAKEECKTKEHCEQMSELRGYGEEPQSSRPVPGLDRCRQRLQHKPAVEEMRALIDEIEPVRG